MVTAGPHGWAQLVVRAGSPEQYMRLIVYTLSRILSPMDLQPDTLFQQLADTTRLRSILLLRQEGELCVCELTYALSVVQPKVSRHLAALKKAGLVSDRRQAQWVFYRLHPELPTWAQAIIATAIAGTEDREPFASDRAALAEMPNRPGARRCA